MHVPVSTGPVGVSVTPQLSVLPEEQVIQYLHNSQPHPLSEYRREWIILDCYRMNIILCISFAVCICPGICNIPSQALCCFYRPVGVSVTPQLSVTTGGAVIQYLHNSQPHPLSVQLPGMDHTRSLPYEHNPVYFLRSLYMSMYTYIAFACNVPVFNRTCRCKCNSAVIVTTGGAGNTIFA
jgi:hypothetical protein